jgi:hypothetical protein
VVLLDLREHAVRYVVEGELRVGNGVDTGRQVAGDGVVLAAPGQEKGAGLGIEQVTEPRDGREGWRSDGSDSHGDLLNGRHGSASPSAREETEQALPSAPREMKRGVKRGSVRWRGTGMR